MSKSLQRLVFQFALCLAVLAVVATAMQQSGGSKGSGTGEEYEAVAHPEDEYPSFINQNKSQSTVASSPPKATPSSGAVTPQLMTAMLSMLVGLIASSLA
ncbi:hypothetical protein PINS_up010817 [Pythium insidiosum]|nr:hypothetical protein PINS_up010817 [Pythium insidiosum]